jgi:glutamate-ammonia-ligase adenylyltransferase
LTPEARAALEGDAAALHRLAWFLAASPGFLPFLLRHPGLVVQLFLEGGMDRPLATWRGPEGPDDFLQACDGPQDAETLARRIARFRNSHLVRLWGQETLGLRPAPEIWREWARVAFWCMEGALAGCRHHLREVGAGVRLAVMGMGKLGGEELNFASDIDLIYIYDVSEGTDPGRGRMAAVQWANRVTAALERVTDEGPAFRVDLGLRPGGKDGEVVTTPEAAEVYYQTLASPWERWALLKAHPVAGDRALGERFLKTVEPFVYRRYLDYGSLEEIRSLKARIQQEVRWKKRDVVDVKLGRGGIREVEFLVQTLQVIFGGRLPHLRKRATLDALDALAGHGLVPTQEGEALCAAYLFLRRVEHRVQMVHLRQTHQLPEDERELGRVAGLMGFDGADGPQRFLSALQGHMVVVNRAFEELLAEGRGDQTPAQDPRAEEILARADDPGALLLLLEAAGFSEPQAAGEVIQRMLGAGFPVHRSQRARAALGRLFPRILSEAMGTPSPHLTLFRMERFLEAVGPRAGYYALLEENPETLAHLISLFARSALLSRWLGDHLGAVEGLIDRGAHGPRRGKGELEQEVRAFLHGLEDPEERLGRLRVIRAQEILRIGAAELWGMLTPQEVGEELTRLADVFLQATFEEALRSWGHGPSGPKPPLCAVALGSFGGSELSYRSDLDLIFLYDDVPGRWRPPRGVSPVEHLTRLGQRVLSWTTMPFREGPGWAVDVRLRPSGGRGPLMVSLDALRRYHAEGGRAWERQALLKARPCAGCLETGARAQERIGEILAQAPPPDARAFHDMRMRMERERGGRPGAGRIHLKLGAGGMADLEFLLQFHQLSRWKGDPAVRTPRSAQLLERLIEAGTVPLERGQTLASAHGLYKGVENRLGLVLDHKGTDQAVTFDELRALEPLDDVRWPLVPAPGEDLPALLGRVMTGVREIYSRFLFQDQGTSRLPAD